MKPSTGISILRSSLMAFLILALVHSSCGDKGSQIPNVPVDFTINVTNTQYIELNAVGGWVYLTGGYRGIIIYRASIDEFMAYDRACPYDWELECARVEMEDSGIICVDSCCGSRYLITDGSPFVDGPSTMALKRYQTYFDGEYLSVYN